MSLGRLAYVAAVQGSNLLRIRDSVITEARVVFMNIRMDVRSVERWGH